MQTIEQLIARYDKMAKFANGNEYLKKTEAVNRQTADLLRELQERRKEPKIIRCKDCKHYEWMSNRIPEEQTWHCHCWDADTGKDDFCSYAERRTDD